jgi:uncharacterized SAM-binding protein YcdF (DUF218 family)
MFYMLSKVLVFFVIPSNLMVGIGLVGILLLPTRFARAGQRLLVASVVLIASIGILPIGNALTMPLEERFPRWNSAQGVPVGIVVLGGVIDAEISAGRGDLALTDTAERVTAAVDLARRYPAARVVFTGGNGNLIFNGPVEADFAIPLFESLGLPRERIIVERRARSTAESAAFTKQLVAPEPRERWLLVTSAMHIPRAVGAFRAVGFPVEAYPVDYRTVGREDLWSFPDSLMGRIGLTDMAVHEWVGIFVYWMTGRLPVLFPAPQSSEFRTKTWPGHIKSSQNYGTM